MIKPVRLHLRPFRLLKATGGLTAQALPLADKSQHWTKVGDESMLVRDLMHNADAQLCYVEVMGAGAPPAFPVKKRGRPPTKRPLQPIAVYFPPKHQPVDGPDGAA